jgi:hypothetical protein
MSRHLCRDKWSKATIAKPHDAPESERIIRLRAAARFDESIERVDEWTAAVKDARESWEAR